MSQDYSNKDVLVLVGDPDTIATLEQALRELIDIKGCTVGNIGLVSGNGARDFCLFKCQKLARISDSPRDVYLMNLSAEEPGTKTGPRNGDG